MSAPKEYNFKTTIIKQDGIDAGFVEFPFDVRAEFGKKGQVKVKAWFDGFEYRGSLVKMGHKCHIIGLNKKVRTAIGKNPGDTVNVTIIEDTALRTVEIPTDLENALKANDEAGAFFQTLSFSNRREYTEWIKSARKQETRNQRIIKSISFLVGKKRNPYS